MRVTCDVDGKIGPERAAAVGLGLAERSAATLPAERTERNELAHGPRVPRKVRSGESRRGRARAVGGTCQSLNAGSVLPTRGGCPVMILAACRLHGDARRSYAHKLEVHAPIPVFRRRTGARLSHGRGQQALRRDPRLHQVHLHGFGPSLPEPVVVRLRPANVGFGARTSPQWSVHGSAYCPASSLPQMPMGQPNHGHDQPASVHSGAMGSSQQP
jgi:hypothetical protein